MNFLHFFQKDVDVEKFFMNNGLARKAVLIGVWIVGIIPAIILFQSFWQPGSGSFSGLFFFLYPVIVLIPNSIVGLVIGLIFGASGVSGLRVLIFSGVAQSLAVIVSTALSSQGETVVGLFIFIASLGLFTVPALPLVLIELGIFYGLGRWLGKKCRVKFVKKTVEVTASVA